MFIQSNTAQAFEDFHSKAYALRIALGFVCGHFAGGKCYFFTYSNNTLNNFDSFRFYTQRDEIKNIVQPVNSNPYAWAYENKEEAEKLYKSKLLKILGKEQFSNLCNIIIENEIFRSTLLLIIEANKASLLIRPYSYCIALETLSDIVLDKKRDKVPNPITSKTDAEDFRNDLMVVLNKYKALESFIDVETLEKKIKHINQKTNKERLTAPFDALGIELNNLDKVVINSRNDFLHGRTPNYKKIKGDRTIRDMDSDLWFASNKLYTLLSLLILKFIGFDGHVINFSKKYEGQTDYIIDEPFYRNK